jgi:beta-glucosidase
MFEPSNHTRGGSQLKKTPALCIPCGTACAATFDTALIQQVGQVLAEETKARASVVLLGPTVNIQRSPLGGRAFESFSEDPTLSGEIAAAYINGLQSRVSLLSPASSIWIV